MLGTMKERQFSVANEARLNRAVRALDELLAQALRERFHGTAVIELTIHDGTIQRLSKRLEAIERW